MDADRWIKLIDSFIPLLEALIWPLFIYLILHHFSFSIKKFIEHSGKFTGKISTTGIEITTEQLETTSQVSASLTAASINKEAISQIPNQFNESNTAQATKPVLNSEKVLEIGYVVGQALNSHITSQLSKTSILWIEDDQQDNTFEKNALKTLGVQITTCNSVEEALGKAQLNKYDIAISSFEETANIQIDLILVTKLKELHAHLQFIIYKPFNFSADKIEALEKGLFGVTNEPLGLFQLVVNAVKEIRASTMQPTEDEMREIIYEWFRNRYYNQSGFEFLKGHPSFDILIKNKDGSKIGIIIKYRTNNLIFGLHRQVERLQSSLKPPNNELDKVIFIIITPYRVIAQQLAERIKEWPNLSSNTLFMIGNIKDGEFKPFYNFVVS